LSSLDTNFTTITNSVNGLTNGASQINVAAITATGTANASTFLRGDGAWATVTGGGTDASYANLTVTQNLIPASSFLRNRIINGAIQISQRTAVNANVAVGTGTSGTFGADRFYGYTATAGLWNTLQITTGASDFPYANRLQRIAGQTLTSPIFWRQIVESVNCTDLSGSSVVLSFYANAGANYSGGAVTAQIYTGTGTDQGAASLNTAAWTGFATPISSTFTPTITRTRYTFTGTIGSGIGELAISLTWSGSGTAGANDYIDITGVQLEVGTLATPFERRQYGTELMLCQRYYQIIVMNAQSPAAFYMITPFYGSAAMRATPTMTQISAGSASLASITLVTPNSNQPSGYFQILATAVNGYVLGASYSASSEL
jgi:hypothetical protein